MGDPARRREAEAERQPDVPPEVEPDGPELTLEVVDNAADEMVGRAHDMGEEVRGEGADVIAEATAADVAVEPPEQQTIETVYTHSLSAEQSLVLQIDAAKRLIAQKEAERRKLRVSALFSREKKWQHEQVKDELAEAQERYQMLLDEHRGAEEGGRAVELHEARQRLAQADTTEKRSKGIRGFFKQDLGRMLRGKGAEDKYAAMVDRFEAEEQYDEARAELMADSVDAAVHEQIALADARAQEQFADAAPIYQLYKDLGGVNLAHMY